MYIDGIFVGYVAENVDVKEAIRKARRELAAESEKRLCMDYEWSVKTEKKPFVHLEKKEALEEQLKNVLSEKTIESREKKRMKKMRIQLHTSRWKDRLTEY